MTTPVAWTEPERLRARRRAWWLSAAPVVLAALVAVVWALSGGQPAGGSGGPSRPAGAPSTTATYAYDSHANRVQSAGTVHLVDAAVVDVPSDGSDGYLGPTPSFVAGSAVAAETESGLVNLASESRTTHILEGHRFGGEAGNTWFPKGWSDDKIMNEISDIATDPSLNWVQQTGRAGAEFTRGGIPVRYTVEGVREGVKIRVVLQPGGEGIITGFPIP